MARPAERRRPGVGWFVVLDGSLALLAAVALSDQAHRTTTSRVPLPPRWALQRLLVLALSVHVIEGVVAGRMARRRGLDTARWATLGAVVGFPALRLLKRTSAPVAPSPVGP